MKNTIALFLSIFLFYASAQDKKMCITIDDLPAVHYGLHNQKEITEGILNALKKHNVPAIGYVNESKLYNSGSLSGERVDLLEQWLKEGQELGNHTFSHMNYHRNTIETFGGEVLKGEKVIKPLARKYNKEIRYFRHPYLRSGENEEKHIALRNFLSENGYIEAPVTIDNEEYLFAKAYAVATKKGDADLMKKVGQSYLEYMTTQLDYFEKASMDLLGRNMDHILLIHANYLNAVYLDALLAIYKKKGYRFISQEEVLKDPAYDLEVTRFDDWGISWIHRWGLSQGLKGDFFKGEAETPDFINQLAN